MKFLKWIVRILLIPTDCTIHWGEPNNPTEIRFFKSSTKMSFEGAMWRHYYFTHRVPKWYGISYKRKFFFGHMTFGDYDEYWSYDKPRKALVDWSDDDQQR